MRTVAEDLAYKPDVYCLYGARLSHVAEIMWTHGVRAVPVVGYIEELGWLGPTIIGVCTDRDALLACWTRSDYPYKNKPQNICVQSVMQRDVYHLYGDTSDHAHLAAAYAATIAHFTATH